jgi:hypothetical protein
MDSYTAEEDLLPDTMLATEASEAPEDPDYVPDTRAIWGSEAARAMLVVLTRRLGPDFAREVSNELASRTFSYQAGCPDDQSDGETMESLLRDKFWDQLFAQQGPGDKPAQ